MTDLFGVRCDFPAGANFLWAALFEGQQQLDSSLEDGKISAARIRFHSLERTPAY